MPPADPLARISERVARLRALHQPMWDTQQEQDEADPSLAVCAMCDDEDFPCVTLHLAEDLLVAVEALSKLAHKVEQVGEASQGIFTIAHVHGFAYSGPNWETELKEAYAALSRIAAGSEEGS